MDPKQLLADERLNDGCCIYCGNPADTREHAPSKIFLDEPFPSGLSTVPACSSCNNGYSKDEAYLACFMECVITGTTDYSSFKRQKIAKHLKRSPKLKNAISESSFTDSDGNLVWRPDIKRVNNVLKKLAVGHSKYELSYPFEGNADISTHPFILMTNEQRSEFEDMPCCSLWPEINSRAFLRILGKLPNSLSCENGWVIVQDGQYRYQVVEPNLVKIVISEYLGCMVEFIE